MVCKCFDTPFKLIDFPSENTVLFTIIGTFHNLLCHALCLPGPSTTAPGTSLSFCPHIRSFYCSSYLNLLCISLSPISYTQLDLESSVPSPSCRLVSVFINRPHGISPQDSCNKVSRVPPVSAWFTWANLNTTAPLVKISKKKKILPFGKVSS